MKRWSQTPSYNQTLQNAQDIFVLVLPAERAFATDVALGRAGWTSPDLQDEFSLLNIQSGRDYDWIPALTVLDIVALREVPSAQRLLEEMSREPSDRASSNTLYRLLEALFELVGQKQFAQVDWLFQNSQPDRLAPELSIGMLRATSHHARWIPSWDGYLDGTRVELNRRGVDAEQVLAGLVGSPHKIGQQS
jgi:hypothetical protein